MAHQRSSSAEKASFIAQKVERRGWKGMCCDVKRYAWTRLRARELVLMRRKGWCITDAGTPDSQTLREEANHDDAVKDSKKVSAPKQMADLLCSAMQSS